MTLKKQFARARHPLLFLALLIQPVAGQLAAAQEEPTPDYALIIDVYSGAVPPDATQEKAFWLWLETLKKTEEPGALPKVIHIGGPATSLRKFTLAYCTQDQPR
jgi:hypothetical protein